MEYFQNILTTVLKRNCSKILARNGHFFNSFYGYDIKNVIFISSINPNLNNFVDSDILINEVNCIYNPNELKNGSNLAIQNFVDKKIQET